MANVKRALHVSSAVEAVRAFLDSELAASRIEIEAKLVDSSIGNPPFEPAHVADALNILRAAAEIRLDRTVTRGGGAPPVFVVADTHRRTRRVSDALARKRLLMSRYYSYVQGGEDARESLAGPAGERAFDAALGRARVGAGLAITTARGLPSVPTLFGDPVPVGPLDNAFIVNPIDPTTRRAIPPYGVHALVEVKNIRQWIYPATQELYQLLMKAADIQARHPDEQIVPILVCRKAHFTTRKMAKDLGFFVIEANRQYLPQSSLIDTTLLNELTAELGIADLVQGTDSTRRTEQRLVTLQQFFDLNTSIARWQRYSAHEEVRECYRLLWDDLIQGRRRTAILNRLREIVRGSAAVIGW